MRAVRVGVDRRAMGALRGRVPESGWRMRAQCVCWCVEEQFPQCVCECVGERLAQCVWEGAGERWSQCVCEGAEE